MRFTMLLLVLASLFVAAPAAAEETRWYGWQTLAVDGAAATVLAVTAHANGDGPLFLNTSENGGKYVLALGLTTYALGGAVVHLAHGNGLKALLSLGLRLGLPLAAGGLGVAAGEAAGHDGWAGLAGGLLGVMGGMAGASAIDASVLAREPVRKDHGISVGVAPVRGGATAGLSGTF